MKRRIIAAALVLVFPFSMAACSSQSKTAACKEIEKARDAALAEAQEGNIDYTDEKALKDYLKKVTDVYKKSLKKVKNKKVKKAYKAVLDDLDKYVDLLTNSSLSNTSDIETVRDDLTKHGEELNNLCGFKWDK